MVACWWPAVVALVAALRCCCLPRRYPPCCCSTGRRWPCCVRFGRAATRVAHGPPQLVPVLGTTVRTTLADMHGLGGAAVAWGLAALAGACF